MSKGAAAPGAVSGISTSLRCRVVTVFQSPDGTGWFHDIRQSVPPKRSSSLVQNPTHQGPRHHYRRTVSSTRPVGAAHLRVSDIVRAYRRISKCCRSVTRRFDGETCNRYVCGTWYRAADMPAPAGGSTRICSGLVQRRGV